MNPITGTITLEIGDETVEAFLTASLTEAPFESLPPIFHAITDELTAHGAARAVRSLKFCTLGGIAARQHG